MQFSPEFLLTLVSVAVNLMLTFITLNTKLRIQELKTLLYEKFVTKDEWAVYLSSDKAK